MKWLAVNEVELSTGWLDLWLWVCELVVVRRLRLGFWILNGIELLVEAS